MGMLESVIGGVVGQIFGGRQSGMSPLVKALLMLLLAKGASGGFGDIFGRGQQGGAEPSGGPAPRPTPRDDQGDLGGFGYDRGRRDSSPGTDAPVDDSLPGSGFDDLSGMLGGGGSSAGAERVPPQESDGLNSLVDRFRNAGLGDVVGSWIGHGANHAIDPDQLAHALGGDTIEALERETGMERSTLLGQLAEALPEVVHRLTPQGRL